MRRRDDKEVPLALRHSIRPAIEGGFELVTHFGHRLTWSADRDDVRAYYVRHCLP